MFTEFFGDFDGEIEGGGEPPFTVIEFLAPLSSTDLIVWEDTDNGELKLTFAGTSDILTMSLPFDGGDGEVEFGGQPPVDEVFSR